MQSIEARTNAGGKTRGMSASILRTKRGIDQQLLLAHFFCGYKKHVFSPQELYVFSGPQDLYNIIIVNMRT